MRPRTASAARPWTAVAETDGAFINEEGVVLFRKEWRLKDQAPRGAVFIIHGAGDHCMRYDALAKRLNKEAFFVFSHDHVGHGQSPGDRMHIEDFQIYVRDVVADIKFTMSSLPAGLPLLLVGISMGGCIAVHVAMQHPELFAGVVLNAPAIKPDPATAKPHLIWLARKLAKRFPQMGLDKLKSSYMTRNLEERTKAEEDPLIYHGKIKAHWGMEMLGAMNHIVANPKEIVVPLLVQQGEADKICNPEGAKFLATGTGSEDVIVKFYPGMFHDLLHEVAEDTERVVRDIVFWVSAHAEGRRVTEAELPSNIPGTTVALALHADASAAAATPGNEFFV